MSKDSPQKLLSTETQPNPSLLPKKLDSSKVAMPPDILTFITMDDMSVRQAIATAATVKIANYVKDRTSSGHIQTWNNWPVTAVRQTVVFMYASQSFYLINDGPGIVYVWVNTIGRPEAEVRNGETLTIDFETHIIERILLQCLPGGAATVRICAND